MNTQENNKMIAEFMGLSVKEGVCYYTDEDDMFPMGIEVEEPYIPYDNDWNWLMPVVEKIKNIAVKDENIEVFYEVLDNLPDRHETYNAVVEFIKQYNESTD